MVVKLKTLILLVALFALPLRGMAAVAMWHCVQDQRDAANVSAEHAADHHGVHEHAAGGSHDPAGHQPGGHPSFPSASACSACAACCVGGAVVPSAWPAFSFAPIGASRIPFLERRLTLVVPAQLERPPLPRSA